MIRKKFCFISGLPRSGSTLLSSILNQNPRFNSGPNSDVLNIMVGAHQNFNSESYLANPRPVSLSRVISSVPYNYYFDNTEDVIFDKNRGWPGFIDMIRTYITPDPKIICLVRNIEEVLTSIIMLLRKNNYPDDNVFERYLGVENPTDEQRCDFLLSSNGICGSSAQYLLQGLKTNPECILLVEYDNLVNNTEKVLKDIYTFIGEEYFQHSFKIKKTEQYNDDIFKLQGMHDVRETIEKKSVDPKTVLNEQIIKRCESNIIFKELKTFYQ